MRIVSKPGPGDRVTLENVATPALQTYLDDLESMINGNLLGDSVIAPSYTVATVPSATLTGWIFVSDETGGAVMAFSDGANWRRCTDRAVIS